MKVTIHKSHTEILPTREEIQELCKAGNPCLWLVNSYECTYHNRPPTLVAKLREGEIVGKKDGCEKVKSFDPSGKPSGKLYI